MPTNVLTLPRDPGQDARVRRFMQQLQQIVNSLLLAAEVAEVAPGVWTAALTEQRVVAAEVFGK